MAGNVVHMDGYATHQVALIRYLLMAPEGSLIVELGTGFYSTPLIREVAKARNLKVKVYYSDEPWMREVQSRVDGVEFIKVLDWQKWEPSERAFLYMLDSEELVINRNKQLDKIVPMSDFVVVHDADVYPKRGVPLVPRFVGEYFSKHVPHTMVIDCAASTQKDNPHATVEPIKLPVIPDGDLRTAVVCAYVPGGDYDSHYEEYIRRLAEGLKKTEPAPDFFCVTYMSLEGIDGVKKIQPKNNFKGWHIKGEIFNPELWKGYDRVLYVDLDTVIAGSIADILKNPAHFGMLRDFNRPVVMETGVVYFDPTITGTLYDEFVAMNPNVRKKDADIVNAWLKKHGIAGSVCPLQDHFAIGSYKVDIIKKGRPPGGFAVVCFHGNPRPHTVGWDTKAPSRGVPDTKGKVKYPPQAVEPLWAGQDCFIIGGGPSVGTLDLSVLDGFNVLGVNDAYQLPCATACFFGDTVWEGHHSAKLAVWANPIYTTSGIQKTIYHHMDMISKGISKDPKVVGWNKNSGFASINLACHLGASRIFLVGYDMQFKDGQSNYHPNIRKVAANTYRVFLGNQQAIADGVRLEFPKVRIHNANPASAMTVFPKITFAQAVEMARLAKG